jgi:hypothetical protein
MGNSRLDDKNYLFIFNLLCGVIGTLLYLGYNQITDAIAESRKDIQKLQIEIAVIKSKEGK